MKVRKLIKQGTHLLEGGDSDGVGKQVEGAYFLALPAGRMHPGKHLQMKWIQYIPNLGNCGKSNA